MKRRIQITESQLKYIVDNINTINEQVKEENLPTIPFEGSFLNNMVTVKPDNPELQKSLNLLDSHIQKAGGEGKTLKSISIKVDAGASEPRATNKLPEGVTKPDHTYNGIVPENMWTTVNKQVQPEAITKLPPNYNINQGYYAIQNGNKFLAQTRAENLQKYLNGYLNKKYSGAEIKINVIDVTSSKEKMVKATIDGIVFDKPTEPKPSPWTIIYPWYQIGASKDKFAMLSSGTNLEGDWKKYKSIGFVSSDNQDKPFDNFIETANNSGDEIGFVGYNKMSRSGHYVQASFTPIKNYIKVENNRTFIFKDEDTWLNELNKLKSISKDMMPVNPVTKYVKGETGHATFQFSRNLEGVGSKLIAVKPSTNKVVSVTQTPASSEDTKQKPSY